MRSRKALYMHWRLPGAGTLRGWVSHLRVAKPWI
jgi:hypothetical protein